MIKLRNPGLIESPPGAMVKGSHAWGYLGVAIGRDRHGLEVNTPHSTGGDIVLKQ